MLDINAEFNRIYDQTYKNVFKIIISKCDDVSYIQDLIQDIYQDIYIILKKKGINYIKGNQFIYNLARKKIYKYYNSKNKQNIQTLSYRKISDENEQINIEDLVIEEIEDDLLNKLTIDQIWDQIKKQEIIIQKILILYYMQNLRLDEIANTLNLNINTVKTKLYRATKNLREIFKEKIERSNDINE